MDEIERRKYMGLYWQRTTWANELTNPFPPPPPPPCPVLFCLLPYLLTHQCDISHIGRGSGKSQSETFNCFLRITSNLMRDRHYIKRVIVDEIERRKYMGLYCRLRQQKDSSHLWSTEGKKRDLIPLRINLSSTHYQFIWEHIEIWKG